MENTATSPATKTYIVWADDRVFQQVEASSPEEAYSEAQKCPGDFEPCSPGIDNFLLLPDVTELDSGEHFRVGKPEQSTLRQASQRFYNAVQNYLDVPDSELPRELVEAMDELEAAWHKADGIVPEDDDEDA